MANNVYRTAYDTGVKRVIVASSNHATDWYEHKLIHKGKKDMITEKDYPVSDNFYGWAKATYELLSWPYASGKFGRKLEFIHVERGPEQGGSLVAYVQHKGGPLKKRKSVQDLIKIIRT